MNHENFCYWLQGWLEIQNPVQINSNQLKEIKNHLKLVSNKPKITPLKDIQEVEAINQLFQYC